MSRFKSLSGLQKFKDQPAPPPIETVFDDAAAHEIVRQAVNTVAVAFPAPDAWSWLSSNRPEIIAELKRVGKAMGTAHLSLDIELVKSAAETFAKYYLKAWGIYEQRPPVIEVQGDLMVA